MRLQSRLICGFLKFLIPSESTEGNLIQDITAFDLDETLIKGRSIDMVAKKLGFVKKLRELRKKYWNGTLKEWQLSKAIASLLKGKSEAAVEKALKGMKLERNAQALFSALKRAGYKTAIITNAFSVFAKFFREKLGADYLASPALEVKNGRMTGKVKLFTDFSCCKYAVCKAAALRNICRNLNVQLSSSAAIGNRSGDLCMLRQAGQSFAIRPSREVRKTTNNIITNLAEVMLGLY